MNQLVKDLKAIKKLLRSRRRWTQGLGARDRLGREVSAVSRSAVCWCLDGAAMKVTRYPMFQRRFVLRYEAVREAFGIAARTHYYVVWNDQRDRKHADVLAMLDRAIKRAMKRTVKS